VKERLRVNQDGQDAIEAFVEVRLQVLQG